MLKSKIVYEHEAGLRYQTGRLVGVVGPGRYWLWSPSQQILTVDIRPRTQIVGGQEVMTRDGATLRVSLVANYRVTDARKYRMAGGAVSERYVYRMDDSSGSTVEDPQVHLHHSAQIQLREWISPRTLQEALDARKELADAIAEPLRETASAVGLTLDGIALLDMSISGNLRAAHSDLLKAELEGQASLQRARNESATMRSLLNTARLVREHPGLLELRILTTGQKPRVHVTVNSRDGAAPSASPADDAEV